MNRGLMKLSVLLLVAGCLDSCSERNRTPDAPQTEAVAATPVAPAAAETAPPAEPEAKPYKDQPGPYEIGVLVQDWVDANRQRTVPVKIYYPKSAEGASPVVVFSHGLGGTREGYEYLGRHWASHGYVSVHVQHQGSDDSVWRNVRPAGRLQAMRDAAGDPL
ncbi:MAG TPA: hypothetical protein PKZ08_16505, partial [Vicinamibacterales bacterium]|nr:hypothetical protein [Vicinamibacterales bacterium]